MKSIKDMNVLITGGDGGLGRALVKGFAGLGCNVFAATRTGVALDLPAQTLKIDLREPEHISQAIRSIIGRDDGVDILINNAAVMNDTSENIVSLDISTLREALEINAIGALALSQMVLPHMRRNGFGRIVNVSSGVAATGHRDAARPAYRLSKALLNAITISLAQAIEGEDILINAACPGWMHTKMGGPGGRPPEQAVLGILRLAMQRKGGPNGYFFRDCRRIAW